MMSGPVALPTLSVTAEAPPAQAKPAPTPSGDKSGSGGITFHEVLSSLNPLQYVPVVGTLYRAVTGDTIPEANRVAGSFVFSGLTGGPVGLATSALTTLLEKVTGFDPDQIGRTVLAKLGLGKTPSADARTEVAGGAPTPATIASATPPAEITPAGGKTARQPAAGSPAAAAAIAHPTSRDLLAAYGLSVRPGAARSLDADALNGMELARISGINGPAVAAAYAAPRPTA